MRILSLLLPRYLKYLEKGIPRESRDFPGCHVICHVMCHVTHNTGFPGTRRARDSGAAWAAPSCQN